ncbi:MAG: hypothetical protein HRT90_06990 [Candidatus Margulisbacteria bacterium]|nr:hypothetical protein [Candidatus Margulisiibacteriota bacterium]
MTNLLFWHGYHALSPYGFDTIQPVSWQARFMVPGEVQVTVFFPKYETYKEVHHLIPPLKDISEPYTLVSFDHFSPNLMYYASHNVAFVYSLEDVLALKRSTPHDVYMVYPKDKLKQLAERITFIPLSESYSKVLVRL